MEITYDDDHIALTNHLRIFLSLEPCDMRKSFNGLVTLAEQMKPASLKNKDLFLSTDKRHNPFRALYYDRFSESAVPWILDLAQ